MAESQPRKPAVRWWVIALLLGTLVWAFVQVNQRWVRRQLEQWGLLAPPWSGGKKTPGGEWVPKEFVPERPGPCLREIARWNCSLVHEVAWFPDNRRLAVSAGEWLQGKGWDGPNRSWCILQLPGLRDTGDGGNGGKCLEVSSKGAIALTTYRKDTPPRWCRIEAYAPGATSPSFGFDVAGTQPPMAFTPDGSRLLTIQTDGRLQVWDAETWKEVGSLTLPAARWNGVGLDIDGCGEIAVVGQLPYLAPTPQIVQIREPKILETIQLPRLLVEGSEPAISPDGFSVTMITHASGENGAPLVYNRHSQDVLWNRGWNLQNHPILHSEYVRQMRFSPDGALLAACGYSGHVGLFDARDGALYDQRYEFDPHTTCVRWSPDGTKVAFGGNGGLIVYEVVRPSGWK